MSEAVRLAFILGRDGPEATAAFARDTMRTYRRVLLERKTSTLYRRRLVESSCSFKRFLIGTARGEPPEALIREESAR